MQILSPCVCERMSQSERRVLYIRRWWTESNATRCDGKNVEVRKTLKSQEPKAAPSRCCATMWGCLCTHWNNIAAVRTSSTSLDAWNGWDGLSCSIVRGVSVPSSAIAVFASSLRSSSLRGCVFFPFPLAQSVSVCVCVSFEPNLNSSTFVPAIRTHNRSLPVPSMSRVRAGERLLPAKGCLSLTKASQSSP